MSLDRTPEERAKEWAEGRHVDAAVDRAVENIASYLVAEDMDLGPEEMERLVDAMYDQLREDLTRQELMRALLAQLWRRGEVRARELVRQFRKLPEARR